MASELPAEAGVDVDDHRQRAFPMLDLHDRALRKVFTSALGDEVGQQLARATPIIIDLREGPDLPFMGGPEM